MVGTPLELHTAWCWLVHETLVPRYSHCCEGKQVVVLQAVFPEDGRLKHLFPAFRQGREKVGVDLSIATAERLRLPTQQPGSAMGAQMSSLKVNGRETGARVHT